MPQGPVQPHSAGDPGSGYDDAGRFIGSPPDAPMEGVEANPMIDPTTLAASKFGSLIRGTKAADLVNAVRAQRAARIMAAGEAPTQDVALGVGSTETPTFGAAMQAAEQPAAAAAGTPGQLESVAAKKLGTQGGMSPEEHLATAQRLRGAQPGGAAGNASGESAASQEAISRTASEKAKGQVRFLVDTRSGHYKPIIGGVDAADVQPGNHEILVQMGVGKDPNAPSILARGKHVTEQRIAALADPKRGMQPKLHPQYQGPARALLGGGGAAGTASEASGAPAAMPGGRAAGGVEQPGTEALPGPGQKPGDNRPAKTPQRSSRANDARADDRGDLVRMTTAEATRFRRENPGAGMEDFERYQREGPEGYRQTVAEAKAARRKK